MKTLLLGTLFLCTFVTYSTGQLTNQQLAENDLKALNYALTLEHLESYYYTYYLNIYNETSFEDAGLNSTVYTYLTLIKAHEAAHVSALSETISAMGGTPVPPCNYSFPVTSVVDFITVARVLENTGVRAYDGAIDTINNLGLRTTAAAIAGVEARHAAYLNLLTQEIPFPNELDNATRPIEIVGLVLPFITECPYTIDASSLPIPALVACQNETNIEVNFPYSNRTSYLNSTELAENDLVALNYALTLENLEAYFYETYLSMFNMSSFDMAGYNETVYTYLLLIRDHEVAHVNYLSAAITSLGGSPVPECTYDFPVSSVEEFLTVARILENTGISAYDGAIDTINDLGLRIAAASIASVEARHASYLNLLTGMVPFPAAYENATAPSTIASQIAPFLVSCPYNVALPVQAFNLCTVNATGSTTGSTTGNVPVTTTTSGSTTGNNDSAAGFLVPSLALLVAIFSLLL